jgi:hypothetical protein
MDTKSALRMPPWIVITLLFALVACFGAVAAQGSRITEAQFKSLASSAKTSDDHKKLAEYYRAHAAEHEMDAKLHDQIVAASRKNPADNQAWELGRAADHYAEHSREAAEALRELATLHDGMAQQAKKS